MHNRTDMVHIDNDNEGCIFLIYSWNIKIYIFIMYHHRHCTTHEVSAHSWLFTRNSIIFVSLTLCIYMTNALEIKSRTIHSPHVQWGRATEEKDTVKVTIELGGIITNEYTKQIRCVYSFFFFFFWWLNF
jgi:hypothetical protein